MANNKLLKDITKYNIYSLGGDLPYTSDRTISNYKKMKMHPMCSLGLSFTTLGLPDVPYIIDCKDEEIKAIADAMLAKIWKRLIRDSCEFLVYGWKPFEIRYEPGVLKYTFEDEKKSWSGILLKQPRSLDPEYIRIKIEDDGSLRGFTQDFSQGEVTVKDKKCLLIVNNFESGNYYGISALEPVYSTWYISSINMQFHTRWLERKGTGLFKGRYPSGKDESGLDNSTISLNLLNTIMEGTAVTLPAGVDDKGNYLWDIGILEADDKTDAFIQFHEYLDKTILRGLIIPERALTQGEIGARASTEAFTDIFMQRKQDVLNTIVDYINRYLLRPFIDTNFGKDVEIEVTAGQISDDSKTQAAKIIEKLIEQRSVEVDIDWLVEKTGIPLIKEKIPEIESIMEDDTEEHQMAEQDRWSGMTNRERKFNLNNTSSWLTMRSEQFQNDLRETLNIQKERIKTYLEKNIQGKSWEVANKIDLRANKIYPVYKEYMNDIYDYVYNMLSTGINNKVFFSEQSSFIGFKVALSADNLIMRILSAIKQAIQGAISRQASVPEIIETFSTTFDQYTSNLGNIAETELSNMMSTTNTIFQKDVNKKVKKGELSPAKQIQRVQATAIMDDRTCPLCEKLDGTIVSVDSPIRKKYDFPLHYGDRCIWLPITQEEIDDPRVVDTDLSVDSNTGKPFTVDNFTANLGEDLKYRTFK